ncbi:MAG: ABC transporter permease subunit [Thermomicrobiales bacterium]
MFRNTLWYILLASLITLAVAVPHPSTFAKTRFPGREGLRTAMIATLIMPPVTFLVPSYVMMAQLGLIDTSAPLVLLWAATAVPGTIFLLSALMRSIPNEILEAARIDGAGYFSAAADRHPAQCAGTGHRHDLQYHGLVERSAPAAGAHR